MKDFVDIVKFCIAAGTIVLCVVLVFSGVFRWLASGQDRQSRGKKLNILAWLALAALISMAVIRYIGHTEAAERMDKNTEMLKFVFYTVKTLISLLAFSAIIISAAAVLFVLVFCISKGLQIIFQAQKLVSPNDPKPGRLSIEEINSAFANAMRTRIVKITMAFGLFSLFIILPFLVGDQTADQGLAEVWGSGVSRIASFIDDAGNPKGVDAGNLTEMGPLPAHYLISYILIYIMVLGICYAVMKILCSIMDHTFEPNDVKSILDEYSSPIALLSVGVAFLWTLKDFSYWNDKSKIIVEFLKSFGAIVVVVAISILVLEIVHLLIDMREVLIRQEGRLLFIVVVGQSAALLLEVFTAIYSAVNSAIGGERNISMDQFVSKLREQIVRQMEEQIEDEKKHKTTFSAFDGEITKK